MSITLPRGAEEWRLDTDEDGLFQAKAELEARAARGETSTEATAAWHRVVAQLERGTGPRARAWQAQQAAWCAPGGGREQNVERVVRTIEAERGVVRDSAAIGT